ncbi:MAG: hypothetical protein ACI9J3_001510 [Parvicellaceae bacterium]|jgi:hypothetical protein
MAANAIYISGLYRSGTTLLSKILDKHSDISITYGTVHFMRYSHNKYLPLAKNYSQLVKDTAERIFQRWEMQLDVDQVLSQVKLLKEITEPLVYEILMRSFLKLDQKTIWGEKTNVEWEGILPFTSLFPNGKVIHIVRDPRAALASFKYFTIHPAPMFMDTVFAASAMFHYINQDKVMNHPNVKIIQYESLVLNPEQEVKSLCDFLEIDFEQQMIESGKSDSIRKPYEANSSFKKKVDGIDSSGLNIWKEKLTNSEIQLTEEMLKLPMLKFGYDQLKLELNENDEKELEALKSHEFIAKRLKYIAANGYGEQAFPNTPEAYDL